MMDSLDHPFRSADLKAEYLSLYSKRAETWPVPSHDIFLETPSGQTYVRQSGSSTAPPLVLLPGSRGTSFTWIPNITRLSAHYNTFALDTIYDFGLSIRRRILRTPQDLLIWLDEVLRELVPEGKLNLVGLSYGAWLASQYALHFPERVNKIVLLAPAATVLPVNLALIFRASLTLIPVHVFRQQFYDWLLADTAQSGPEGRTSVDEAVADWEVAQRCFSSLPLINATVLKDSELQQFKVPALFLVGEHEKLYSPHRAVNRLNHLAPQIKTEIIPQAGHDLSFVQAGLVTAKILDFLGNPITQE